jgi:hypothetical protein
MRKVNLLLMSLATVASLACSSADARAQATTNAPQKNGPGEWGWTVLGSGLALGGALTTYGLTFDCSDTARECQRRASIAIWGGIGIAALSSAIGIAIVQMGRVRVRAGAGLSTHELGARFGIDIL